MLYEVITHYLLRFAVERSRAVNTAALGGNAALLSLEDNAEAKPRESGSDYQFSPSSSK